MSKKEEPPHNVLQLHGGGTLVLSEVIKCAILEMTTGKRINDLFQTTIADSGGAFIRLCMERLSAADLLAKFITTMENIFPSRRFYLDQSFSKKPKRFDNSFLINQMKDLLQDLTFKDFKGNLFVGAHQHGRGAISFEKLTMINGQTDYKIASYPSYKPASPNTPLSIIAQMSCTVPGLYDERSLTYPEYADGTYLDAISNQEPAPILSRIKSNNPDWTIFFLQIGHIENKDIVSTLFEKSVVASTVQNLYPKYITHHSHSAHLVGALRILGEDHSGNIRSLTTHVSKNFSPVNTSADQLTEVAIITLADIEARREEYEAIALRLNSNQPLCMSVEQAIAQLKVMLDPMMKKRTIFLSKNEVPPTAFPSPHVVWAETGRLYKPAYALGRLTNAFQKYLVANNIDICSAFHGAYEYGLKRFLPSPHHQIEPQ